MLIIKHKLYNKKIMVNLKRFFVLVIYLSFFDFKLNFSKVSITKAQAKVIGEKIWKNECASSVAGLTSWNKSEEFPSLGIGHFIWFPKSFKNSNFKQTFPSLIWFMKSNGVKVPKWIKSYAPWENREQFLREFNSIRLKQLRKFLVDNIDIQVEFMVKRLIKALPIITKNLNKKEKSKIIYKFRKIANSSNGLYILIDYINFKGYGENIENFNKDYNGIQWGLLQVLQKLKLNNQSQNIAKEFYKAAKKVLIKRILYASKDERHWWPGWKNRLKTYIT